MPIELRCTCGTQIRVPDKMAGRSGRCRVCKAVITVPVATPEPAALDTFRFPEPTPHQEHSASPFADSPRSRTVAPQQKSGRAAQSPLIIISGIAAAAVAYGVAHYAAVMALIPGVAGAIGGAIAHSTFNERRKPFVGAFAVQFGHVAWLLFGVAVVLVTKPVALEAFKWVILEYMIFGVGVAFLVAFPGVWTVAILIGYQSLALCVNSSAIVGAQVGSGDHQALVVHIVLRLAAIGGMMWGIVAFEKAESQTTSSHRRARRDGVPSLAIVAGAALVGIAIFLVLMLSPLGRGARPKPAKTPPRPAQRSAIPGPPRSGVQASPKAPATIEPHKPQPRASRSAEKSRPEVPRSAPPSKAKQPPPPPAPKVNADGLAELRGMRLGHGPPVPIVAGNGGVLIGFDVTKRNAFGGDLIESVRPIFLVGDKRVSGERIGGDTGTPGEIIARDGYAVGKLEGRQGMMVNGFKITFMRQRGNALDSNDAYESPWIGHDEGGSPFVFDSQGKVVRGICGSARKEWLDGFRFLVDP